MYQLYGVSRINFFMIVRSFPFISDRIVQAGSSFVDTRLTETEAAQINTAYPNSVWSHREKVA